MIKTTQGSTPLWCILWAIPMAILASSRPARAGIPVKSMNVIDRCWRSNHDWRSNRQQIAKCSVGFAGKMMRNIGLDVINYEVTDPRDDPLDPKPGMLRYAMTHLTGKVWITFTSNMEIRLAKPLFVKSFTTIDGRGVDVHIAHGACLVLNRVTNVIIHGLNIHNCMPQDPGPVKGPGGKLLMSGWVDGDAIRMVSSRKIWIDHNTLHDCEDGLIDVTRGSTGITISNNWFKYQNKVMLLGHNDGFERDKNMKVTVAFNYFGPECSQRMPRIRHGYAHVVNNMYMGWGKYAIGGSMNPSIKSQANLFVAVGDVKEVTWDSTSNCHFRSVNDVFENGASFSETADKSHAVNPNYRPSQIFEVADGKAVRAITVSAGALHCLPTSLTC